MSSDPLRAQTERYLEAHDALETFQTEARDRLATLSTLMVKEDVEVVVFKDRVILRGFGATEENVRVFDKVRVFS